MAEPELPGPSGPARRDILAFCPELGNARRLAGASALAQANQPINPQSGDRNVDTITTKDGVEIFCKDWGPKSAQPIVFHHGWPLSSDDWDAQMLFFVGKGYRVVAHDRRGPRPLERRSVTVTTWTTMPRMSRPSSSISTLRNAIHIGHSTGGGEATRYRRSLRPAQGRVAKLIIIGAVPPIMVKTQANPGGLPIEVFDGLRKALAANRAQFYLDFPSGPFYGFNRPGAKPIPGVIQNWWRQGMMGGAKAHCDGIKAFSETDFTEDLRAIDVPTLVVHGDDDQIVPIAGFRAAVGEAAEEGDAQGLRDVPARDVSHRSAEAVNPDLLPGVHRGLKRWFPMPGSTRDRTRFARGSRAGAPLQRQDERC